MLSACSSSTLTISIAAILECHAIGSSHDKPFHHSIHTPHLPVFVLSIDVGASHWKPQQPLRLTKYQEITSHTFHTCSTKTPLVNPLLIVLFRQRRPCSTRQKSRTEIQYPTLTTDPRRSFKCMLP